MTRPHTPNIKYVAILAVVAGLILAVGSLARPRVRLPEQAPPSETDLARLGRLTERRALESAGAFLAQVADDVARSLVWVDRAGASGIQWRGDLIVTARFDPMRASPPDPAGRQASQGVQRVDWSPHLPVASVAAAPTTGMPVPGRAQPPAEPGAPLVAVWQTPRGRLFAPATFIDWDEAPCGVVPSQEVRVTLAFTRAMAGGGVFDLDGGLLGMIVPCGDRYAAVAPEFVDRMLETIQSVGNRLDARYGLVVEPLTGAEAAFFKVDAGAMVRELAVGRAAAAAGLRTGDIVIGLNGARVSGPADLRPLATPEALPSVVISARRDSAPIEVEIPARQPAVAEADAGASGLVVEPPRSGFVVAAVVPGSPAAAAGVQSGDRVTRVGSSEPRTLEQVRRALDLRAGSAIFLEIERAGRRRGTLVTREAR